MNPMLKAFWQQAKEAVDSASSDEVLRVGGEFEYFLYNLDKSLATDIEKFLLLECLDDNWGIELGAHVVEYHPGPVTLQDIGFENWYEQLLASELLLKQEAHKLELLVGSNGTTPFGPTSNIPKTSEPRYGLVPNFHDNHRPWWDKPVFAGMEIDASVVGKLNASHLSIQAKNVEDGVDILNRMFAISPVAVALGANASILGGVVTGWADCRMEVWKRSHDTRNLLERILDRPLRIGLPKNYFPTIRSYFDDISKYPFIINNPENALNIGIGLYWRDARLKFIHQRPVVEFRALAKQATLERDIALFAFVIGRLTWSQTNNELLPPMAKVRKEKEKAERLGKNAYSEDYLKAEIIKAKQGLHTLGLLDDFTQTLLDNL